MQSRLVVIGATDIVALILGQVARRYMDFGNAPVALSIAAVGLITLFGLLSATDSNTRVTTRFAIAVSSVAVWFSVIGSLLFYLPQDEEGAPLDLSATLADEALQTVSVAIGVILAFYFGSQAYQAVAGKGPGSEPSTQGGSRTMPSVASPEGGDERVVPSAGPDDRRVYD